MSAAAVVGQVDFAAPTTTVMPAVAAATVAMPAVAPVAQVAYQASPVTYVQAAPAAVMQAVPMPTPTYMYPAGSTEVPVYSSAVTAPHLYQQPAAAMPTVTYQQAQPMTQEQLRTIFPMGAPSASTFQPFTQTQYQYNYVDSASAFVPASLAGIPVAPAAPVEPAPAASVMAPEVPVVVPEVPATTVPAPTVPATIVPDATTTTKKASSKKVSSKKAGSSKKLSSKKKEKGCC
uniref:Uncharacterized protein n=1 Tax=Alexandrium monilatum TaxID=311494 RepID=A0A7S4W3C9_9DINO